jgi:hypothetical protein
MDMGGILSFEIVGDVVVEEVGGSSSSLDVDRRAR